MLKHLPADRGSRPLLTQKVEESGMRLYSWRIYILDPEFCHFSLYIISGKGKNVSQAIHASKCTANAKECLLNITASSAGTVIGKHGRNIIAISSTSGARVDVCNDGSNPTMRIVKVIGLPEQIKIATKMVRQRIVERGFPSPTLRTNWKCGFCWWVAEVTQGKP